MKKNTTKLLSLMLLVCILLVSAGCANVTGIEITTLPTKVNYVEGEVFDPAGLVVSKVIGDSKEAITDYTIDKTTALAVTDTVVTVKYEKFSATIDIKVSPKLASIEIATLPTKTVYGQRDGLNTLDLAGGKVKLVYTNGTTESIDLVRSMLPAAESASRKLGVAEYVVTYEGMTTKLAITYENQAISVSEFLTKTEGTFDVTGIVVSPVSTHTTIELLIKDTKTQAMVGVSNSGVAGKSSAPLLDTTVLNVGDEVIVQLTAQPAKVDPAVPRGCDGKIYGNAINSDNFRSNLIVVSSSHPSACDFSKATVTTISTQEQLTAFLGRADRFHSYVKLSGVKAVNFKGSLRIFFGDQVTDLATQKINGCSPFIYSVNFPGDLASYFTNLETSTYAAPATTTYDIYAIFVGGNSYYHDFAVIDATWFVKAA